VAGETLRVLVQVGGQRLGCVRVGNRRGCPTLDPVETGGESQGILRRLALAGQRLRPRGAALEFEGGRRPD
jgi:hypothetical protein